MEIPHYKNGTTGRIEVDPSFLGDKVKSRTLRATVLAFENNRRVGTHSTKTRADVRRSKKAIFRQKGLGRGRVRHPQVAQCRGGGVAHGPHPRDYSAQVPKKVRRVALKSALLSKFRDGQTIIVDGFDLPTPKTAALASVLRTLGCAESCLIVSDALDRNLILSARNLPRIKVMNVKDLNARDVVFYRHLVLTQAGFNALKEAQSNER